MVESIEELRRICESSDPVNKKYPLVYWRKVSIYFTKLLLYTSITANQVTILGALIGVIGGILLAFGNWYTFIGALLLYLNLIFDLVDGEVARYRKGESLTGIYVELLCHHIVDPFVFVGISFNVYNVFHDPRVFIFGFSAILSRTLMALTQRCKFEAAFTDYFHHRSGENAKKCRTRCQSKQDQTPAVYDSRARAYLASKSKVLHKISLIVYIVLSYSAQTMRNTLILLTSLIDMAIPMMMIGPLELNLMYTLLIFYGTFSHLLWVALAFLAVKTKSIDSLSSLLTK